MAIARRNALYLLSVSACSTNVWHMSASVSVHTSVRIYAPRRFQNLQVVLDALVASMDVLGMLAFLLLILLVVFSTVLFYIEGPEQKDGWNSWNSIPAVMWFTQVGRVWVLAAESVLLPSNQRDFIHVHEVGEMRQLLGMVWYGAW